MSPLVEEFYNRVHNPADGKFGTSGTGGGHYKGRAAGAKKPGGSSKSKATLNDIHRTGKTLKAGKFQRSEHREWADHKRSQPGDPNYTKIDKAKNEKSKVTQGAKLNDIHRTGKTLKAGTVKRSEHREWADHKRSQPGSPMYTPINKAKNEKGAKIKKVKVSASMEKAYEFALKLV